LGDSFSHYLLSTLPKASTAYEKKGNPLCPHHEIGLVAGPLIATFFLTMTEIYVQGIK